MNPVQCVFPFEIVLAPQETGFVQYLAMKKKRASERVCQMFLFLGVPFSSVSLANKQIDHSWTCSVKSLHKTEAKSDVIYSGKDWKQGNWFNNAISNTSNDCIPLKLQWKPSPKDQCFTLNHSILFCAFCTPYHKKGIKYFFSGLYIVILAK